MRGALIKAPLFFCQLFIKLGHGHKGCILYECDIWR